MKTLLHASFLLLFITTKAQITTPVIRANFGVDADLRSNYFNGFLQNGNDDWFSNSPTGTGAFIIDTTGAASMVARYLVDPNFRKLPFFRTMRYPQYSVINNRLLIDAVYIRDYNGNAGGDSTAFVMSNKNGDSPQAWTGGVTSVLDKNDIAEMMIHVRREGPSKSDSLWFFGGISLQGTTGSRYFDFELYQTDIFYSRTTGQFYNYGPDAGHTSWRLDNTGQITQPGDVIFTAEYSSSSLSLVEARIWVDKRMLTIVPADFDWTGQFDGASNGAQYGYASIRPKNGGTYYTGLQSGNNTWAGPFGFIDGGNNYITTYSMRQYMEFSVNLTKLGLDPITLLGGSACGLPFRRILVKTRSSTSFTSELKDFIGPFDFFTPSPVQAQADVPVFCGTIGVSNIWVTNALPASVYNWSTPDGSIVGATSGTSITVNAPGTYIVSQQLLDGCGSYAADTVVVRFDSTCSVLSSTIINFRGSLNKKLANITWTSLNNNDIQSFVLERSTDGVNFEPIQTLENINEQSTRSFLYNDDLSNYAGRSAHYRLRVHKMSGVVQYTNIIRIDLNLKEAFSLSPNPAQNYLQVSITSDKNQEMKLAIVGAAGQIIRTEKLSVKAGNNVITLDYISTLQSGTYMLALTSDGDTQWKKFIVTNTPRKF